MTTASWATSQTAVILVDLWDRHWCKGAERRVAEMAPAVDQFLKHARRRGLFVIHAPSTTVDFYKETPQRKRAQDAPFAKPTAPLATSERWGTAWCWPEKEREPDLPIDDSDMGCDCEPKCKIEPPWTRQIASVEIGPGDAITDNGQETYNLLAARGIKHVIILGVHTNMCVLGRPFAIRQLVKLGFDVALVRDLTDAMYNSRMRPFVDHFTGVDLVVEHIEKHWCPTLLSTNLTARPPFRFQEDKRTRG